jgi:hypothetical protein
VKVYIRKEEIDDKDHAIKSFIRIGFMNLKIAMVRQGEIHELLVKSF